MPWLIGAIVAGVSLVGAWVYGHRGAVEAAAGVSGGGPGGESSPTVPSDQLAQLAQTAVRMLLVGKQILNPLPAAHAVMAFQLASGLPATGVVDAATKAALMAAYPSWNGSGV